MNFDRHYLRGRIHVGHATSVAPVLGGTGLDANGLLSGGSEIGEMEAASAGVQRALKTTRAPAIMRQASDGFISSNVFEPVRSMASRQGPFRVSLR
jgi:hypothetical protein